jgi:hypothetical protein
MARDKALLQQAIADAKAISAAAEANARMVLEEAFKPQLSSMISARLRNELKEGINPTSSGIGTGLTVDEPAPKMPSGGANQSSKIPNPGLEVDSLEEALDGLEDDDLDMGGEMDAPAPAPAPTAAPVAPVGAPAPVAPVGAPAPVAPAVPGPELGMGAPAPDLGMGPEMGMGGPEMGAAPEMGMGGTDELDLDAIIRELELDIQNDAAGAAAGAAPQLPESFQDPMAGIKVDGAQDGSLKEEAEGVHKDGKSPKAVDGVNGGKKVSPGQEVTATGDEKMKTIKEEWELDEILREMEAEDTVEEAAPSIAAENAELKQSLSEHRKVVKFLHAKINEVNLLNAKLLFTNKLFRGFELNGTQKGRVVETFDRAANVREVKLIYATLAENFTGKTGTATPKKVTAITEGLASAPGGSTKPKSAAVLNENVESNDFRNRMQKLAGINKN